MYLFDSSMYNCSFFIFIHTYVYIYTHGVPFCDWGYLDTFQFYSYSRHCYFKHSCKCLNAYVQEFFSKSVYPHEECTMQSKDDVNILFKNGYIRLHNLYPCQRIYFLEMFISASLVRVISNRYHL